MVQVADLWPGTSGAYPTDLVAAGDRLVFAADDGASGRELWITDGAHVQRLPEAWPGAAASTPTAVAVDPAATRILFSAVGPTTWREPYRIDLRFFADGFESRQQHSLVGDCALTGEIGDSYLISRQGSRR